MKISREREKKYNYKKIDVKKLKESSKAKESLKGAGQLVLLPTRTLVNSYLKTVLYFSLVNSYFMPLVNSYFLIGQLVLFDWSTRTL